MDLLLRNGDVFMICRKSKLLKNLLLAAMIVGGSCTFHYSVAEHRVELTIEKDPELSFTQSIGYGHLGPASMNNDEGKVIPLTNTNSGGIGANIKSFDYGTPENPSYLRFDVSAAEDYRTFFVTDSSHNPHAGDIREITMNKYGAEWTAAATIYSHTDACGSSCNDSTDCMDFYDVLTGGKLIIGSVPTKENPQADFRARIHLYSPDGEMVLDVVTDRVMKHDYSYVTAGLDARFGPNGDNVYFSYYNYYNTREGIYRVPVIGGPEDSFQDEATDARHQPFAPAPAGDGNLFYLTRGEYSGDYDYNWLITEIDEQAGLVDQIVLGEGPQGTWESLRVHPAAATIAAEAPFYGSAWDVATGQFRYGYGESCGDYNEYFYKTLPGVLAKNISDLYSWKVNWFAGYDLRHFTYPTGVSDDGSWLLWDYPACEGEACCINSITDEKCGLSWPDLSPDSLEVVIDGEGRLRDTDRHRSLLTLDYNEEWRVRPISPAFISEGFAYFIALDGRPPFGNLPAEGCLPLDSPTMKHWCVDTNREHVLDARPVLARADLSTGQIESLFALAAYFRLLDLSPDGSRLLFFGPGKNMSGPSDQVNAIWSYDIASDTFTSLVGGLGNLQPWFDNYRNSVSPCYW